jgi:tRNA(fMet)-specific endonuclease VapC
MTKRWLLDANTLVYAINRTGGVRMRLNQAALEGEILTSSVALAELLFGAEKSARADENRRTVYQGIARIRVIPFTASTAVVYGRIRAHVERIGRPHGSLDLEIAATALQEKATLVTTDGTLLQALIPGLDVETWLVQNQQK